jgi:hypothetical protein
MLLKHPADAWLMIKMQKNDELANKDAFLTTTHSFVHLFLYMKSAIQETVRCHMKLSEFLRDSKFALQTNDSRLWSIIDLIVGVDCVWERFNMYKQLPSLYSRKSNSKKLFLEICIRRNEKLVLNKFSSLLATVSWYDFQVT